MKKVKKQRAKKPSKLDLVVASTEQAYAHVATEDIVRQNIVLSCKLGTLESEIFSWQQRLADARQRKAGVEAVQLGLQHVVTKR